MSDSHEHQPSRFTTAAFVVFVALICFCYVALRHIQAVREAARRDLCHDARQNFHIFGLHPATCPPCRRRMIEIIADDTFSEEARVTWIRDLISQNKDEGIIVKALQKAVKSSSPDVRKAALNSLEKMRHKD